MRTLRLNETSVWYVRPSGYTDYTDGDGNYTGEKVPSYDAPVNVNLSLYPNDGKIRNDMIGTVADADMFAVSTTVVLKEDDLIFYSAPTSDYDTTYDLRVTKIMKSLNGYQYILGARV